MHADSDAEVPENALSVRPDLSAVEQAYERAVRRYVAGRRAYLDVFVDQYMGFKGSLRMHRKALGWDLLRAPVNAVGGPLTLLGSASGHGLSRVGFKKAGNSLRNKRFILETDVARHLNYLLHSELLLLPYADKEYCNQRDGLFESLLEEPVLKAQLGLLLEALGPKREQLDFRQDVEHILAEYVDSRVAAAEITSNVLMAAGGWMAFKKMTPGLVSLSSTVATSIAHQAAVHGFWAGPWAAKLYYGVVGVSAPWALSAGVFGAMLIPASFIAAFAGVVADPVQRRLGWHQRRLHRLLDTVEAQLLGQEGKLGLKDHYVARVFDIFDWSQALIRLARQH